MAGCSKTEMRQDATINDVHLNVSGYSNNILKRKNLETMFQRVFCGTAKAYHIVSMLIKVAKKN